MKLLWLVVVAAVVAVNWYYIQAFHAVANQMHDLRSVLAQTGAFALGDVDPVERIRKDLASAYSTVNAALTAA